MFLVLWMCFVMYMCFICVFCRELRSPRPFLGQILHLRFLRSLVVWSRSTLGPVQVPSLFHGLRIQHCADRAWTDCFTVSLRTGIRLSPGLFCVTSLVDLSHLCHFAFCFMNTYIFMRRHYIPISIVFMCLCSQFSLPITETSRHPFQFWKFFAWKWGPSLSLLSIMCVCEGGVRFRVSW